MTALTARRMLVGTLFVLLSPAVAAAQDFIFTNSVELATANGQSFTTTQTLLNTVQPNDALDRRPKQAGIGALFGGAKADGLKVRTAYAASPAVSRRVKADFLAWAGTVDRADAGRLEQAMRRYDFVQIYDGIVGDFGLSPNDTGDSYTAYWILNWMMANRAGDPAGSEVLAVRSQVRQSLAGNKAFAGFSDGKRQEMAEVFIYNFVVQHGAYFGAVRRGDNGLVRRLSDAAQTRFAKEMGIDLRALTLTSQGFGKNG